MLIAGFPRSGNTWLLYCAGMLTGCDKIGGDIAVANGVMKFQKIHVIGTHDEPTMFSLRNYRESATRHAQHSNSNDMSLIMKLIETEYMTILRDFDSLKSPKMLVRYEDMMRSPKTIIQSISAFLVPYGATELLCNMFLSKLAEHQQISLKNYGRTKSGDDVLYYSKSLGANKCDLLDRCAMSTDKEMFEKYLQPYFIKGTSNAQNAV